MKTVKIGNTEYQFMTYAGKVVGMPFKSRETFSERSALGQHYSFTTTQDTFFLADENGREQSHQLIRFNIACQQGHSMKVIAAARANKPLAYVAVCNETTGAMFFSEYALGKMMVGKIGLVALLSFCLGMIPGLWNEAAALIFGIIGMVIGLVVWNQIIKKRVKRFIASFKPGDYQVSR